MKTFLQYLEEDLDVMTGISTIAPAVIAAGAFALPAVLPRIIDRIKDAGKPSIIPAKSSAPTGPVGKLATNRDLDRVNQSNSARERLERVEAQRAQAEGRRPNPVAADAVAKLARSRVSAARGVMSKREKAASNRPVVGSDGV